MRLPILRLDTQITTDNLLCQSRKSAGLCPSNVLGFLMALANEVMLLDSPMVIVSRYQVEVHPDALYDVGACTAV